MNITDNERYALFDKMELFSAIETQIDLYENFYENEKDIAKSLKKYCIERRNIVIYNDMKGRDQILRDMYIDDIMKAFMREKM